MTLTDDFVPFALLFFPKVKDGDEQPQLTVDIEEPHTEAQTMDKGVDLVYSLNDRPPWYLCILLGFQVNVLFFLVLHKTFSKASLCDYLGTE